MNELIQQYLVPEWKKPFKRQQIYVWVAYQKNPPYLPLAVADSASELSSMIGKSRLTIEDSWYKYNRGKRKKTNYYKFKIGLLEDEDAVRQKA